jgi:hypothetical protein
MSILAPRPPDDLDSGIDKQGIKKLKVVKVEPFGIFLEDSGFVHVKKLSDFHLGSAFKPGEIAQWYPVGSTVLVKLERKEKLLNGKVNIFYDFLGPADVIDVQST